MREQERWQSLSLVDKLKYVLFGKVYLEHRQLEGWSGPLPFYLLNCEVHGPYEDYPHGYDGHFSCPVCYTEMLEKGDTK